MKKRPDKMKELREEIEATVRLYGLAETEETLNIVILGMRSRVCNKNLVVEIGADTGREK